MLAPGRTYCMDCVEGMGQLGAGTVDCVIADPPFNLRNGGRMFRSGKLGRANDMDWDEVDNGPWLREALRVLKPTGSLLVFGTHHNLFEVGARLQGLAAHVINTIALVKTNGFGVSHRLLYERTTYVLWASPAARGWTFDYALMKRLNGGKQLDNVWRYTPPSIRAHPTQKSLDVLERLILMATRAGDLVVDPFMGSGTTAEACVRHGRRFAGFERLPTYTDAANARIAGLTWAVDFARGAQPG